MFAIIYYARKTDTLQAQMASQGQTRHTENLVLVFEVPDAVAQTEQNNSPVASLLGWTRK
ncbi:hypothetical protein GCM10011499_33210 [Pelagibacterium lentulum]|uniref:Uncharacterized protein n=1 Tax=Pelagibacterium lentulum TaxID=2029865 RepID=A0A916RL60_9HYPH|nr:hypothetical protein GCM10011499_33210 [Pelagibacterium lentulum]